MIAETIPKLQRMSASDKLALATELWEELEGMDERLAKYGEIPSPGVPGMM